MRHHRYAAVVLSALSLFYVASATAATTPSPQLRGKYGATVTSGALQGALKGKWVLNFFAQAGVVKSSQNGKPSGSEKFSVKNSTLTLSAVPGCPGKGVYTFKLSGKKVTFKVVKDACSARRIVFSYTYTRIS